MSIYIQHTYRGARPPPSYVGHFLQAQPTTEPSYVLGTKCGETIQTRIGFDTRTWFHPTLHARGRGRPPGCYRDACGMLTLEQPVGPTDFFLKGLCSHPNVSTTSYARSGGCIAFSTTSSVHNRLARRISSCKGYAANKICCRQWARCLMICKKWGFSTGNASIAALPQGGGRHGGRRPCSLTA